MRLVSYNIHKGIGGSDRRYRLERIMTVLAELEPDLVCLQEVDRNVRRSHYHDQPRLLTDHMNAAGALYQLNVRLLEGGYGNLILSRWPFRSEHVLPLRLGARKPRGAQLVVVDTPEGGLHLVNLHLGLAERERRWQVHHLLHHPLFRAGCHLPTLVVGDTNDWRNCLARRFGPEAFHLVTAPLRRFRSFPAFMPVAALDKVFSRGDIEIVRARVFRSRLSRQASDHLPLVVDFHLSSNGRA